MPLLIIEWNVCVVLQCKQKLAGKKRLMPMLDVVTRWNSTHDMLARFVQIQAEIYSALADMKVI